MPYKTFRAVTTFKCEKEHISLLRDPPEPLSVHALRQDRKHGSRQPRATAATRMRMRRSETKPLWTRKREDESQRNPTRRRSAALRSYRFSYGVFLLPTERGGTLFHRLLTLTSPMIAVCNSKTLPQLVIPILPTGSPQRSC